MTALDNPVMDLLEKYGWSTCPEIAKILAEGNERTTYYKTRVKVFNTLSKLEKYRIVEKKKVANVVFWRLTPRT